MFAWKRCMATTATALLAVTVGRADDAPAVVVGDSGRAEEAHTVPGELLPLPGKIPPAVLINDLELLEPQSEYWIGVVTTRPTPALQAQLSLPKDQGLVIEVLQPESPAAKAGLRQYDVLLKGNNKPLTSVYDLLQLIGQVKDGKLTLDLLRAGKQERVTITPAKRPARASGEPGGEQLPPPTGPGGLTWNVDPNASQLSAPLQLLIIRPGQILPPGSTLTTLPGGGLTTMEITVHARTNLADGYTLEITRHGAEPAQIVVTHDKEKWEGTSSDLSKIPDKVRPEIEKLLHPAFDQLRVFGGPAGGSLIGSTTATADAGTGGVAGGGVANVATAPSDVEKRLNAMQKQIDQLRHSIEALQNEVKKSK